MGLTEEKRKKYFNILRGEETLEMSEKFDGNPIALNRFEYFRNTFDRLVGNKEVDSKIFMLSVPELRDGKYAYYSNANELGEPKNEYFNFRLYSTFGMLNFARDLVYTDMYGGVIGEVYPKESYPLRVYEFDYSLDVYKYTINPIVEKYGEKDAIGFVDMVGDLFGNNEFYPIGKFYGEPTETGQPKGVGGNTLLHLSTAIFFAKLAKKAGIYERLENNFDNYINGISESNDEKLIKEYSIIQVTLAYFYRNNGNISEEDFIKCADASNDMTDEMINEMKEIDEMNLF